MRVSTVKNLVWNQMIFMTFDSIFFLYIAPDVVLFLHEAAVLLSDGVIVIFGGFALKVIIHPYLCPTIHSMRDCCIYYTRSFHVPFT